MPEDTKKDKKEKTLSLKSNTKSVSYTHLRAHET